MARAFDGNPRTIDAAELEQLGVWMEEFGDLSGIVHDLNSDQIIGGNQRAKIIDLDSAKVEIIERFASETAQGTVALGYVIFEGEKFNYRQVRWSPEKCARANLIANKAGGDWDYIALADWRADILEEAGFTEDFLHKQEEQLSQLAALLDITSAPVEAVPFADYGGAPQPDDGFIPFKFGEYAGRVAPEVFQTFKEAYEEARRASDSPMLSDVLRGWLNV